MLLFLEKPCPTALPVVVDVVPRDQLTHSHSASQLIMSLYKSIGTALNILQVVYSCFHNNSNKTNKVSINNSCRFFQFILLFDQGPLGAFAFMKHIVMRYILKTSPAWSLQNFKPVLGCSQYYYHVRIKLQFIESIRPFDELVDLESRNPVRYF